MTARQSSLDGYLQRRLTEQPMLLMAHLVVGYPSLEANWEMLQVMQDVGVDLVELQLPFSDPIADGPAFVHANQVALERGIRWTHWTQLAAAAVQAFDIPVLFMGYANSALQQGEEVFCQELSAAGGVGFILPDLPPQHATSLHRAARRHDLDPIVTMTPASSPGRLAEIAASASGFVYCAARKGVTGQHTRLSQDTAAFLARARATTPLPLGVGFGIQTAEDIRRLRGSADIAIVGTAGLHAWKTGGQAGYATFLHTLTAASRTPDRAVNR